MKFDTAKSVHQYFDDQAIKEYVEDRIKVLHTHLEDVRSMDEVCQTQGKIMELRYLLKAKEYAKAVLEKGR